MIDNKEYKAQADSLPIARKKEILQSFKEVEFHKKLKCLFCALDSRFEVEITHGRDEYGKDLVLIQSNPLKKTAIGVVVKMGSVTGKSGGAIDEIKSQISMARSHPARLKSHIEELPITEVYVVIAGTISGNAQERIKKEFPHTEITFYGLRDLVDLFSEYYPEVYFGGEMLEYAVESIRNLESQHLFPEKGLSLTECFVDPFVVKSQVMVNHEGALPKIFRDKKLPFHRFSAVMQTERRMVLLGDAGSGKSTFLRKMAIESFRKSIAEMSDSSEANSIKLPLFCKAKDLISCESPEAFGQMIKKETGFPTGFDISMLLVDALDEVTPANRAAVLNLVEEVSSSWGCDTVISSRPIDLLRNPLIDWVSYELLPLEFGQALSLFEKVVGDESKTFDALKSGLLHIGNGLVLTPLSLRMLVDLAEKYNEVPASVTELYSRYTDQILGRFDREKGIEVLFDYEIKRRFLAELAYVEFIKKDLIEITQEDFSFFSKGYLQKYGISDQDFDSLIQEIERVSVLEFDSHGFIRFKHRSFLEFFGAFYLEKNPESIDCVNEEVVSLYFNPLWTDVAFYYFGLKKGLSRKNVDEIFGYENETDFSLMAKLTVGRLLQAGWHSESIVKQEGVRRSSEYAGRVRSNFLEWANDVAPDIYGDFMLMSLANTSFKSAFLENDIRTLLDGEISIDEEGIIGYLCLLYGVHPLLSGDDRERYIDKCLDALSESRDRVLEARGLVYLLVLSEPDSVQNKLVRKQWRKFGQKYHSILRGILPKPKKW